MRFLLQPLLIALLIVGGGHVQAQEAASPAVQTELESQVFDIARQLRCPTCVSESVADSNAGISIEMRREIQTQLQAGASEAEVLAFFQDRYGDWILLEPPRRGIHLFVWWLPGIALAAGAGALAILMIRWTRAARQTTDLEDTDEADLARVRAALQKEEGPA